MGETPGEEQEESLLRSVALQNARSILLARRRAETELVEAKDALEAKTRELAHSLALLRATLESSTDAILATDSTGRITSKNHKLIEMWRLSQEYADVGDHRQLVECIARNFRHPERFLARVEEIYATSPPETYDLLELSDGRVFERYTRIQFVDGQPVGRVWSHRDITERRRAEDALRRESERLRVTLASIGDAVITTDSAGRVASLNPVAEALTGWTEREAVGRSLDVVFRIIGEDSREPVENPALRALQENRIVGLTNHTLLIARNGMERQIDDSAAPIRDDLGRVMGVVLIFRDVSARRAIESSLRESVAQFRQLADALPQIVWTAQPDGYIHYYNERWYEFTGFARDEYGDQSWVPILHPDDVQPCLETYYGCIRTGGIFQNEYRFKDRRTGGYRWFLGLAYPVRDEQGGIVRWFGTCTDIDHTKRSEETTRFLADAGATLAELTDFESTLQRVASLAVPSFADWCAVDMEEPDGSIRLLAATHADPSRVMLARELLRRNPPQHSDTHGVGKVLRSGEPDWMGHVPDEEWNEVAREGGHLRILRRMGSKSWICVPLRSRSRTIGVLTFATAESGRTYDANDLTAAQDLAHRAVIAIENANLLTALKDSDRRKDEFLAILAHELRNPLAPIRNAVHILHAKCEGATQLQWAALVIDRQVQQMTRLVDDLLDISRINRGKIQLYREPVELAKVIHSAVEASRPLIERSGHTFTVTMPPEPIHLDADLTRLSQVLLNLLNNAAKYTDDGGNIWLDVQRGEEYVTLRVRDSGIGIPPEMLPQVFEMFTQVDRSLERSEGGLGIGLTLVRRLVEKHGGTVEARSEGLGKGSEFVVRLPIILGGDSLQMPAIELPLGEAGAPAPATSRILVVDDNTDAADSMAMLLRLSGNDVRTAHDGVEAVEVAADFVPDVVLLDIGLPRMNGFDAARSIRAQHGPEMMLIAVTGWGKDEDRRRSAEAGFDHHLTKPVDPVALQKLLSGGRPAARR